MPRVAGLSRFALLVMETICIPCESFLQEPPRVWCLLRAQAISVWQYCLLHASRRPHSHWGCFVVWNVERRHVCLPYMWDPSAHIIVFGDFLLILWRNWLLCELRELSVLLFHSWQRVAGDSKFQLKYWPFTRLGRALSVLLTAASQWLEQSLAQSRHYFLLVDYHRESIVSYPLASDRSRAESVRTFPNCLDIQMLKELLSAGAAKLKVGS